ncbi:hypothetical protein Droror1_Dr00009427 [Drosera rotundifolia]
MSSSINHHHQPYHDGGGGAWIHPCSLDYYHRLHQHYSTLPPAATTATTTIPSSDHLIRHQQQHYPSTSSPPLTYYFGDRLRIPPPLMFKFWIDKWSHRFTGFLEHDDDSFLAPWRFGDNAGGGGGEGERKVVVFDGVSLFSYDSWLVLLLDDGDSGFEGLVFCLGVLGVRFRKELGFHGLVGEGGYSRFWSVL